MALNAADISRASICRLALALDEWFPRRDSPRRIAARCGLPREALETAFGLLGTVESRAARERELAAEHDAAIVTILDTSYPEALRHLSLPPPLLYVKGSLPDAPAVAIVGSRKAAAYGRESARFFARALAVAGVTIVSGFAVGVDAEAHAGALEVPGGRTVAVLGCGLDVPYPKRHSRRLTPRIVESGAVVSEFPFGADPLPYHFPVRNRIIAALAAATLVAQATPRSGSLITARLALDLGREIFAVPGRIFDEAALGPNALIRDGARVALHPRDVLEAVGVGTPADAETGEEAPPLSGLQAILWSELVPGSPAGVDDLAERVEARVDEVLAALLELEIGGWAERHPGPMYSRRRRW